MFAEEESLLKSMPSLICGNETDVSLPSHLHKLPQKKIAFGGTAGGGSGGRHLLAIVDYRANNRLNEKWLFPLLTAVVTFK